MLFGIDYNYISSGLYKLLVNCNYNLYKVELIYCHLEIESLLYNNIHKHRQTLEDHLLLKAGLLITKNIFPPQIKHCML